MSGSMNRLLATALALAVSSTASSQEKEAEGFEEQDFLFLTEVAYTQEDKEWQIGLFVGYFDHLVETQEDGIAREEIDRTSAVIEIECGITDRLQLGIGVPYSWERLTQEEDENTDNGIGDIEFAIGYAFLKEQDGPVELTGGIELSAPTGDEEEGLGAGSWGWGPFLALSKRLTYRLYVHARVSYGLTRDAEEDGEEVDERELGYGVAVVYKPAEHLDLITELVGARSEEDAEGNEATTHPVYLLAGVKYEWENDLQLGVGVPVGLNDDSFDVGAIVKVQYEFR